MLLCARCNRLLCAVEILRALHPLVVTNRATVLVLLNLLHSHRELLCAGSALHLVL